jgi:hypothetical protein
VTEEKTALTQATSGRVQIGNVDILSDAEERGKIGPSKRYNYADDVRKK